MRNAGAMLSWARIVVLAAVIAAIALVRWAYLHHHDTSPCDRTLLASLANATLQCDYDELLASSLLTIERSGPIETIVLVPALAPEAREAAKRLRRTVEQSEVTQSNGYDLPRGYFVLKSINISGADAQVVGTLGPIPSNANLACGTTYDIAFFRKRGRWKSHDEMDISVC